QRVPMLKLSNVRASIRSSGIAPMKPAPRRWEIADLPALPGLPSVLGRVLATRGYDAATARDLLDAGEHGHHDPFLLAGMPEAVIAVGVAVRERQRIAVYGDYDAD